MIRPSLRNVSVKSACRIKTMLFAAALLVAASAALMIHRARVRGRADQANLGQMSLEWVAEHRASRRS